MRNNMISDKKILDSLKLDVNTAANQLISEALGNHGVTSGARVAVTDDDATFPYSGLVGRAVGAPDSNGYTTVEFADGRQVPVQTNQLVTV